MNKRARKLLLLPAIIGVVALTGCSTSNIPKGASLGQFSDTPGSISLVISPSTIPAAAAAAGGGGGAAATATIVIHVKDRFGNPISDGTSVVVLFSGGTPLIPGTAVTATVVSPVVTLKGVATSTLTPGPQPGTGTVTVVVDDMQQSANFTITAVTAAAAPPAAATVSLASITMTAQQTALQADGQSNTLITATLIDNTGASITEAGKSVNFSTDSGSIQIPGGSPTNVINGLITGINGQTSVTFIAPKTPGLATITASSQGKVGTVTINNFGTPFSIQIDPDIIPNPVPAQVFVDGSGQPSNSTIFFKVVDRNGSPVLESATRTVEFIILNGGLGGGESVSPGLGTGSTISNGIAKTVFRAGARAGTVKIIAFIETPILEGIDLATTAGSGTISSSKFAAAVGIASPAGGPFAGTPFKLKVLSGADQGTYTVTSMGAGTATVTPVFSSTATGIDFRVDHGRLLPGDIQTNAIEIGIAGDLPSGENVSITPVFLNIAGLVESGLTDTITSFLADRFNNPVPLGTSVNFTTFDQFNLLSAAAITGAGITLAPTQGVLNSEVQAILRSQTPDPVSGFVQMQAQTFSAGSAQVRSLLFTPVVDTTNNVTRSVLYAGTDGGGVFRSPNPNITPANVLNPAVRWIQAGQGTTGLFNGVINVMVADPQDPSLIWAGTNDGVFRSHSSGEVWEDTSGRGFVVGDTVSVTWTQEDASGTQAGVPGGTHNVTVASVDLRLNYTSSGSRSKTTVHIGNSRSFQYQYDAGDLHVIHLFNQPERTDGTSVLQALFIPSQAPIPAKVATLNASITVDYQINDALQGGTPVRGLAVNPSTILNPRIIQGVQIDTRIIYAGLDGAGVYRSTDGGFSWSSQNSGLSNSRVLTLAYDRRNNVLYAGTLGGGLFRTRPFAFKDGATGGDDLQPNFDANGNPLHVPLQWDDMNGDARQGTDLLFREVHSIQISDAIAAGTATGAGADPLVAGAELVDDPAAGGDLRQPQGVDAKTGKPLFNASRSIVVGTKLGGVWIALDTGTTTPTWRAANVNTSDVSSVVNTVVTSVVLDNPNTSTTGNLYASLVDDDDPQTNLGGVYMATITPKVEFAGASAIPTAGPTVTFLAKAVALAFSDSATTLTNKVVRGLGLDTGNKLLYAGTNGRNVFRKDISTAVADNTDNWTLINDPNGQIPSAIDQNLPTAITNIVYGTNPVLFSGSTIIQDFEQIGDTARLTPTITLRGNMPDIPNLATETFVLVVCDQNGNPLVGNSSVSVQSTGGQLGGSQNFGIPDTRNNGEGLTEFTFTFTNNIASGTSATNVVLSASVNSPISLNGAGGNGSVSAPLTDLSLEPPVTVSGSVNAAGNGTVTARGGSLSQTYQFFLVSASAAATITQLGPNSAAITLAGGTGATMTVGATNIDSGSFFNSAGVLTSSLPAFDALNPNSYGSFTTGSTLITHP